MKKVAEKICKYKKLILIVSCILLVLSFVGMKLTKINYDILVYLPDDIETIQGQNTLTNDFNMGSYSIAIIENMNSKDIIKLEDNIRNVDGVNEVVSLYDAIGTTIPVEFLPEEVTSHLHDENTDLLFITFSDGTSSEETIDAVREIRELTGDSVKLGGMSSMVLDTMNLSEQEIFIYIIIAVILCIVVLELSLDSYLVPILLLANIGIAILFNLGTNIFLGQISYITKALVAVLQLGVTTDFSIFLYHSYESKKDKYEDNNKAMADAICETFTSVVGSSLTTIAGFLVLCTMELTLGKDLGIVMAKGVLLGVICVLTLFPSLLLTFDKLIQKTKHKSLNLSFTKLNNFIVKHHVTIFVIFLICLVPAYLGYKKIDVYYKIDKSLPETLESISTNNKLKDNYNIVSPEIILVDNNMKTNDIVAMTNELKKVEGVDFVLSFDDLKQLGISENMLPENLLKIFKSDKYEMILLNSVYEVASDELNEQIDVINKVVKKYDDKSIVAGEGPLMKDLITISDTDFNNVNYSSIGCILVILFIILKSFSLPLLLICAIESAIFINMSFSYFGGVVLPFVAPIVLGTIQLGATIDYAILLTSSYLNNRKTMDAKEAMINTLNYNGRSILVSGLCFFAATFGVGLYSKLEMVGSLCTLISRGAIVSMIVVITVLPSILLIFDKIIMKTTKGCKNNMKKNLKSNMKKVATATLAVTVLFTSLPIPTMALTKSETIYGKLATDGKIKSVYVNEHLINNDKLDTIEDYTDLEDIINLNGDENFKLDNNKLTWESKGNDIFYQGKYQNDLPVSVNITYKLDGKEMNVSDMLGKEGKVEITLKYTNNDKHIVKVNGSYETLYTPFVVTLATTLSESETSNIEVSNGKFTSNGTKNIIAAIASPGLYESLKIDEFKNMDTVTIKYDTKSFSLNSIYSVITPKLIDSDDLDVFSKLDTIYNKANTLQESMNLIDTNTQKLKAGSNQLKSELSKSISALTATSGNTLTEEQVNGIKNQTITSINQKFTDEYKTEVANQAWNTVKENMDPNDSTVVGYATTTIQNIVGAYLQATGEYENYVKCQGGDVNSCGLVNLEALNSFTNSVKQNVSTNSSQVSMYVAENTSKQVASEVAYNSALLTASEVAPSLADQVANSVKNEALNTVSKSLNTLYNGIDQIDNGINQLSDGVTKFNNEGIKTITSLINNNVKGTTARVKALVQLGDDYKTVNSKNVSGDDETKMILVVDSKKTDTVKKETKTKKEKTSFIDRVVNLFNF